MLYPSITNIVAVFYTSLCWRCSVYIKSLTDQIEEYSPEEFGLLQQLNILKSKKKVYDALHNIQDTLSMPIFFVILANVFMCSAVTGGLLVKSVGDFNKLLQMDFLYYLINGILCVVGTLWIAGRVPIEMSRFKNSFYQKTHERLLHQYAVVDSEEKHLKMDFCSEQDFVLTGYNILPLRRSTILALIGTLFTYTALVMDTNRPDKI
ncbi:uncharacterized protein NPIL_226472 [Nephila pilipes]|uniref:Gustatory receptor n=2 Tax=Nephila pilipes TaxID=299642 RepID=A0A8X6MD68_NEPPI|nr:uncharacterized protein NPIL_226472 [Nephila pilipes]